MLYDPSYVVIIQDFIIIIINNYNNGKVFHLLEVCHKNDVGRVGDGIFTTHCATFFHFKTW